MAFTIPNVGDAAFSDQAEPDSKDFEILGQGVQGSGVVSGCAVSAQATPDMTVAVASGTVRISGTSASVTAGNLTIGAADASNARFDFIAVDNAGTKSVVAGTASANPVFPAVPANSIILASVYVPANDTAINSNQIIDKRVFVITASSLDHGSLGGLSDDDHTQYVLHTEVDDTPVNGATTDPISSNWAFDHEAAADPHTGYRLESADHSHASSGLQGGQVSHADLTNLTTGDPHTQYRLESADHSHQSTGLQAGQLDHGLALTGLTDDDHTQYALLAGRAGGQVLIGGTAASDGLTLRANTNATPGSISFLTGNGPTTLGTLASSGNLSLPVTGSTAGLTMGGDTQIYRGAPCVIYSPDSLRLSGHLRVGATCGPSNTTAGDLTATRGHLGTDGAFSDVANRYVLSFETVGQMARTGTITRSGSVHAGFLSCSTFNGSGCFPIGIYEKSTYSPSASISNANSMNLSPHFEPGACVTIANTVAGNYAAFTGSGGGAITNFYIETMTPVYGTVKPTNSYGVHIADMGSASITTAIAMSLTKPTNATNNYYINFATACATDPTGGGGAAAGRIPVIIGGVARYLAYY